MDRDATRRLGWTLLGAGAVIASPLDEAVTSALTGGAGLVAIPVQGPLSLVGGVTSMAIGGLLLLATRKGGCGCRR